MKYQVGDKVMVRADLTQDTYYQNEDGSARDIVNHDMLAWRGKVVTISSVRSFNKYKIEGCTYNWTDGMFEPHCVQESDDVPKETLMRTMVVAWEMGDMDWYWELAERVKELESKIVA